MESDPDSIPVSSKTAETPAGSSQFSPGEEGVTLPAAWRDGKGEPHLPEQEQPADPPYLSGSRPAVIESILKRRSIRRFKSQEVERGKLVFLLEAGMSAPNACNSQPWEFVVITEKEVLDALRAKLIFARYNAPAGIVVCGNPKTAHNSAARHYWVQDCSAAAENILIAASGLGLGAVWIGVYPLPSVIRPVSEVLGLPEHVIPLCLLLIGYPDEDKPPRTQYDERRVYWQVYEHRKVRAKKKNAKY